MSRDALARLVTAAEQLPGAPDHAAALLPRRGDRRRLRGATRAEHALEPGALKTRVRELLFELARRVDETLPAALQHAAWDQIDALRLFDPTIEKELLALQRAARLLAADAEPARRALGIEADLTLDAAVGLTSLVERRLATLVRLRLRAGEEPTSRALVTDGRPFLDLGAALFETARRWS